MSKSIKKRLLTLTVILIDRPLSFQEPVCILLKERLGEIGLIPHTLGGKWQLNRWLTWARSQTQLHRSLTEQWGDNSEISWPCAYYLQLMTVAAAVGLLMEPAQPVGFISFILHIFFYLQERLLYSGRNPILRSVNLICLWRAHRPIFLQWRDISLSLSVSQGHIYIYILP